MSTEKKEAKKEALPAATREGILGSTDLKTEAVEVPDWGCTVNVHTLTGNERDAWEERCVKARDGKKDKGGKLDLRLLKAKLVIASVRNDDGSPLFSENDAEALNKKSAKCISDLSEVCQRLSGLSDKEAEEIAGN